MATRFGWGKITIKMIGSLLSTHGLRIFGFIPGSHVILAAPEGMSEDALATDIQRAAEIAAFYSKARSSTHVPVDYTRRKAVWKPNGAKPGFVLYEQQKTALVKPLGE